MTIFDLDFKRTAALDLSRHLDHRLSVVLQDFMDRCAELEIDYDQATTMALTIITHYTTAAAIGVDATEDEFLELCRLQYQYGSRVKCL